MLPILQVGPLALQLPVLLLLLGLWLGLALAECMPGGPVYRELPA